MTDIILFLSNIFKVKQIKIEAKNKLKVKISYTFFFFETFAIKRRNKKRYVLLN
jgi:hypothetical protein